LILFYNYKYLLLYFQQLLLLEYSNLEEIPWRKWRDLNKEREGRIVFLLYSSA